MNNAELKQQPKGASGRRERGNCAAGGFLKELLARRAQMLPVIPTSSGHAHLQTDMRGSRNTMQVSMCRQTRFHTLNVIKK